ncbi:YvrJ family protein [Bacillus seohaeanensis]|jgi:preprotein translocase subunit SecF|uniref:YvrJ family protein n=1 Tax=Bacillus seohaeanensis TaxID=284580 RepID=A0ABW5RQN8_9BACI
MMPVDLPIWVALLGNFGFPIAITIYLFVRFERKIEKLETVIMQLSDVIKEIKHK